MSYFTIEALRTRMGEAEFLAAADINGDGQVGIEDEARVQQIIDEACSEIDSYVGTRYPVPLAAEHRTPVLLGKVVDVIRYHLHPTGDQASEQQTRRYDAAIEWAKKIGCGKAQLGVTAAEPDQRIPAAVVTSPECPSSGVSYNAHPFSIANMRGLG